MIFKILGCRIRVSFYLISILSILMILNTDVGLLIALFLSIAHEIGHILMFICTGRPISEINFELFSVDIIETNDKNFSYKNDFFVLIGGSFMNFFISLICFVIYIFSHNEILKLIYIESLFIGILNLMPVSSLDGGRILKIFLEKKMEFAVADKISFIISILFLIPIATLGFLIFLKFRLNPSLLILCVYLVSFLIAHEPKQSHREFIMDILQ